VSTLVLASASPRRADLLRTIGCRFEVVPSHADETTPPDWSPEETVSALAEKKADEIAARFPERTVVGADTIVVLDGQILGKPVDRADAHRTLTQLSGHTHQVLTAVCLIRKATGRREQILSATRVVFRQLSDREIQTYLDTDEPYDKAGAYGIQGQACVFVDSIEGCFYNVVGFPLTEFWLALDRITDGEPEHYRESGQTPDLLTHRQDP